jgi:hypothetical protein
MKGGKQRLITVTALPDPLDKPDGAGLAGISTYLYT